MRIVDVRPTPLFPRASDGGLAQVARLTLEAETAGDVTVETRTRDGRSTETHLAAAAGEGVYDVTLPDMTASGSVDMLVVADGKVVTSRTVEVLPMRRWTVHVMPTSHIDLYSTGLAHETPEEHARILDAALELAAAFPEYRFQVESMLPLFEFRQLRGEQAMARLAERIRGGQIAFGAQHTGLHMEEASGEELVQGQFLMMRELESAYGIRPNCGYTVDVPGTTAQYAQLLARCGISGWIFSPNRFPPPDGWYGVGQAIRLLPRLLRARGLDGSSVLAWLPHEHYGEDQKLFGLDGDVERAAAKVVERLLLLEDEGYPFDAYLLEHSYGDNLPPDRALPELVAAWRQRYAFPRLVLATAGEFFQHVAETGPEPPSMRLEVQDAWAWIVGDQGVLNQVARRAGARLLTAQALLAVGPDGGYPEQRFRDGFSDLAKFQAHDWWYGGGQVAGVPDLAKAAWADGATRAARELLAGSLDAAVANPCAFPRRDVAIAPAGREADSGRGAPCQAVDAETLRTHFRPEPHTVAHPPANEPQQGAAVFVADMPALGTPVVAPRRAAPSQRHQERVIESAHYRVEFDRSLGAIASVVDKGRGRELAAPAQDGFGQLLIGRPQFEGFGIGFAGTYEMAVERMRQSLKEWEACHLELDHGLAGPVFSSLVLRGEVHGSPVTQAVVLYEQLKRIDVTLSIEWKNEPAGSRLVIAFPFAFQRFRTRYEIPFGVLEVGRDETPVAPRHLRQLQTWLQFSEGQHSVVLASPDVGVFSLGRCDLNPVEDADYTIPERAAAYFTLADNGAPSPLVQPGRLAARFAITSGDRIRPSDCTRFGWSFARPPVMAAGRLTGGVVIEPDSVLVSAVKRARDGGGLVVRVVEYDGVAAEATLRLPFSPREAWLADPTEHPIAPAANDGELLRFRIEPHEILTYLVRP